MPNMKKELRWSELNENRDSKLLDKKPLEFKLNVKKNLKLTDWKERGSSKKQEQPKKPLESKWNKELRLSVLREKKEL